MVNETKLERILRPVRINPVGFSIGVLSSLYALIEDEAYLRTVDLGISGVFFGFYLGSIISYFRSKRGLVRHGFDERFARKMAIHYCDRQALYVACVERGYRGEFEECMERIPIEHKALEFIPHV